MSRKIVAQLKYVLNSQAKVCTVNFQTTLEPWKFIRDIGSSSH